MKRILIGTTNLAKFNDYRELLKEVPIEIVSLYDLKVPEPKETGNDFEENAVLKARYYFQKTGIPTLADDSGLEIDALGGAPGVKTHRWLGRKSSDEEFIQKVYRELKKAKTPDRTCRMRITLAIASPFGVITSNASVDGIVAPDPSPKRIEGYPFKSVIYFPNYNKYFSELSPEEMEILDHRRAAVEKVKDIIHELSR